MTQPLRIAQIKLYPVKCDLAGNHARLMAVLAALAPQRPDVVVTPEGFLDGYIATADSVTPDNIRDYAVDPAESPYVRTVAEWAASHRAWVVLGAARLLPAGVANSALLLDRSGQLAGTYDKVHCRGHDLKYVAGNRLPVFDSDFGRFGVMICADRRWPETVRALALQGARVVFNPTYGNHSELNVQLMRTRAFENELFIAFTHPGQALITGPDGRIVADKTSPSREFAVTEIDLAEVDARRENEKSFLRTRRPDVYGNLAP
jgi:predicted amidohydrolase